MIDWLSERFGLTAAEGRLVQTVAVILVVLLLRLVVVRVVHGRVSDPQVWFRTRKYVTYVTFAIVALVLVNIWLGGIGGALTYLGIVSAAVALALADVLENLAGWVYILLRRPFRVGDRVEILGHRGDVVDIRVFRFTLLELGNWVGGDQSTGRLVHIPNGQLFTEPLANYTEGFPFIWDEVPVLITFESDWELGEEVLLDAVRANAPDVTQRGFAEHIRRAARAYLIEQTSLEPAVYVSVEDSGVLLTGRYLVAARERRAVKHDVWRGVLRGLAAHDTLELAYPTVRTWLPDPLRVNPDGIPSPRD